MAARSDVVLFKTASNKPIKVDSSILSAALAKTKRFDDQYKHFSTDELFEKDFNTPNSNIFLTSKKASSEGRSFRDNLNFQTTPVSSRFVEGQSQSASLKRRSVDNVPFVTPKRFMNSNSSSNPFKMPRRKVLTNTPLTTPKFSTTPVLSPQTTNTPDTASKLSITSGSYVTAETPLRTINKNLDIDNCEFVKIKNILKKESKGKDVIGVVLEASVTENNEVHMLIVDNSYHGVNAELVIPSMYITQFEKRVKGRVITVKNINMTKKKKMNILKISPEYYRFDSDSFDAEDLRDWYAFENVTLDKFKIM